MSRFPDKYRLAALPVATLDGLGLMPAPRVPVAYVVERANWSIRWDGTYVVREIERIAPGTAEIVERVHALARRVVHFFSQYQWEVWGGVLASSNRYAVTFYHGKPEDDPQMARHIDAFLRSLPRIDKVVTAASLIEQRLLAWGVPREKLVRIPIAVDLDVFRPMDAVTRARARARFGIPEGHLAIGSFQKDGVGWGEGDEPKLIKGPDVLLETVAVVAKKRRVFVLLTGPARGYVKRGLDRLGIPYAHDFVDDYEMLPERYAALDVYLNPSRDEGGPKGVVESMATGVPIVSTGVGMAPDLIRHRETGFLAEPGDSDSLAQAILEIDGDVALRVRMTKAGREAVAVCDVPVVGRAHWERVVQPLLQAIGRG
jgi:glycosyltransferase involved in cell wall biosynthesis